MIYLVSPFSKAILAQLQRVRTIEHSNVGKNICVAADFKGSLAKLSNRGLVNTKTVIVDGKEILSVYITEAGKFILDKRDARKLGSVYNIIC